MPYAMEYQTSGPPQPLYADTTMWSYDPFTAGAPFGALPMVSTDFPALFGSAPSPTSIPQAGHVAPAARVTAFNGNSSQDGSSHTIVVTSNPLLHQNTYHGGLVTHDSQLDARHPRADDAQDIFPHLSLPDAVVVLDNMFPGSQHTYHRIVDPIHHVTLDASLKECLVNGLKAYKCIQPGCYEEPFYRKFSAHAHIIGHLAPKKLFGCKICPAQFSSEGTAKRHRDRQTKRFSCGFCHKMYRRQDYCNLHERKFCKRRPNPQ